MLQLLVQLVYKQYLELKHYVCTVHKEEWSNIDLEDLLLFLHSFCWPLEG